MNDEDRARRLVEEALHSARDQHVDEVTFVYEGARYPVAELRRLHAAGQLDTLPGPLAFGAPYMLQEVDLAEANGEKRIGLTVFTGDPDRLGWVAFMPLACEVLLPDGWELLPGKAYLFDEDEDPEEN